VERHQPSDVHLVHPEWSRDATIYQINTRHFTPEGTFTAAAGHLERLAGLGVSILWLMPVHEIGEVNRKGMLGSPYAVRDYLSVNPDLGTVADLRAFVDQAHALGMHVILDWVANHTAWDNVLVEEHPEWYARDWKGDLTPTPWWGWDDIIDLDYAVPELRDYMVGAMEHWVREVDIDGYRCDVAGLVPTTFWERVRTALEAIKPVFLLAEWESRELHDHAFDATYGWSWNNVMHAVASGDAGVEVLRTYYAWNAKAYPHDAMRMLFVTNHDQNAWDGSEIERFGEALEVAIVLSVLSEGIPLVFNGQEAGNDRSLPLFEDDQIEWREHPLGDLYRRLIEAKKANSALWNGSWGAPMVEVYTSKPSKVLAFARHRGDDAVFMVANLSPRRRTITLGDGPYAGAWKDLATGEKVELEVGSQVELPGWGYQALLRGGFPA